MHVFSCFFLTKHFENEFWWWAGDDESWVLQKLIGELHQSKVVGMGLQKIFFSTVKHYYWMFSAWAFDWISLGASDSRYLLVSSFILYVELSLVTCRRFLKLSSMKSHRFLQFNRWHHLWQFSINDMACICLLFVLIATAVSDLYLFKGTLTEVFAGLLMVELMGSYFSNWLLFLWKQPCGLG